MALDELVSRGADLAKLRKMALADASGADLRNELKRLGYMRLGERSRAVSALKAAANGRVAGSGGDGDGKKKKGSGSGGDGWDSLSSPNGLGGSSPDSCKKLATIANEAALLNELAVVEAPRVRELGLYKSHNDMYIERFGKQAELGANDSARPWEAIAVGREYHERPRSIGSTCRRGRTPRSLKHERARVCREGQRSAMQAYRDKDYQLYYDAATSDPLNRQILITATARPRRSSCAPVAAHGGRRLQGRMRDRPGLCQGLRALGGGALCDGRAAYGREGDRDVREGLTARAGLPADHTRARARAHDLFVRLR